jgi:hypothetical protein
MYSAFLSLPPRSSRTSSMRIVACANPTPAPPRRNVLGEGFRKRRRSLLPLPLVAHRSSLIAHRSSLVAHRSSLITTPTPSCGGIPGSQVARTRPSDLALWSVGV